MAGGHSCLQGAAPCLIHALEVLPNSRDNAVVRMAAAYWSSVSAPSFLLCLEILNTLLSVTKPLSVRLQTHNKDLRAIRSVDECMGVLQSYRDGDEFDKIFDRVMREYRALYGFLLVIFFFIKSRM